jgi:hypothetical protein
VLEIVEPLLSEAVDGEPMELDGQHGNQKSDELYVSTQPYVVRQ